MESRIYKNNRSFTLIELLVVLAIVAVLSVVVILTLNPVELIKQARDSTRTSDLSTLNSAISMYSTDVLGGFMGTSSIVYVSYPDSTSTCSNLGLPSLPNGWVYNCVSPTNSRNVDGSGWVPINFSQISFGSPISQLPLDPKNTTSSGLYYTFVSGANGKDWGLSAVLEAAKDASKMSSDGGASDIAFENGPKVSLTPIQILNRQAGGGASYTITQTDDTNSSTGFNLTGSTSSQVAVSGSGSGASIALSAGAASWANTTVDSVGAVGFESSLAIGSDGFARISYSDITNGDLKFAQCTNASCSTSNVTTVDSVGIVGRYTSLAMGTDGFARISYYDQTNNTLKFARCTNASCSTKVLTAVDPTGGQFTSIAIGSDGFARMSYIATVGGNPYLKFARCANDDCSTFTSSTIEYFSGTAKTNIALGADGFARIGYGFASTGDLKFTQCTDADCATRSIVGVWYAASASMSLDSNGFGRMTGVNAFNLRYAKCANASCSSSALSTIKFGNTNSPSSVVGTDGLLRAVYGDSGTGKVESIKCLDANCSSLTTSTVDPTGSLSDAPSVVISNSLSRVSYVATGVNDLKYAHESTPYNSSGVYTSGPLSLGGVALSWGTLSWAASGTGTITVKVRSSATSDFSSATAWGSCANITNGANLSTGNCVNVGDSYLQYQASLSTADTSVTPSLDSITLGYNR